MKIKRLDEALARKIAAGEVIERPASVVKELVENALDAKSESISIDLVDGGISSIIVRDDGEGMTKDDIALCVQRHTTSKIAEEDDLTRIATLGFRGEALASIAAVCHLRIVSKTVACETAHELRVSAGEVGDVVPAARDVGTTVEVRDLFYNLPARSSFLTSARSEFFHCNRIVHRLALCSPSVGFALTHGNRAVFSAPPVSDLRDRIGQLYGPEIGRQMIPISEERDGMSVRGYISSPDVKRGNRRDQIISINGRSVDDSGLSYILQSAYRGILRPGAFPLAVIEIGVPYHEVDVNIHPRKLEVRLASRRAVQDLLDRALNRALSSRYVVPTLSGSPGDVGQGGGHSVSFHPSELVSQPQLDLRQEASLRRHEVEAQKVRVRGDRRVIGQLQQTYILVETPDGLEIVDQHIAHERILYEKLSREVRSGDVAQQRFLLPVRVELPFESAAALAAGKETLAKVGIDIDDFGGGTFLVRGYPSILVKTQVQHGFTELLEKVVDALEQGTKLKDVLFDHLIAELACGAAIKAGDRLSLNEQQELIDRLLTMENPYTCPHGRPIIFSISRHDLDLRFKRA
ncbi:DNA mismatch repair endonuclease MutL [Candidatus Bipolaricaulota bacterium]|nr:DNA mismatch repair endonuclease MutL [Candidatus Bipolaricaulota bacterium]